MEKLGWEDSAKDLEKAALGTIALLKVHCAGNGGPPQI